ncbi:hypothetical protein SCNU_14244 [Gordonia neofelifaecis NRRL B-59395]|uniref:Uncharacterized protein n=1 Tax=Gordonia neofelifaecis NRRL B-59395 TaxID=644548 RepID=F1YLQ5_9ACTN|nr:hypothetical protein SCNU_14244 [Gordonia neofelifaecis NRRL B-59395]
MPPQQVPPQPFPPQAPQPRPPFPPGPYPPAQYQPGPFPPGPYQPGPYQPGPWPPAKKSRKPLVLGLLCLVVVAAAVTTLLIVAPWKSESSAETTETFALDNGVSVEVRVPAGWTAVKDSDDGHAAVMLRPADDSRALSQLSDDISSIGKSGSGTPVHAVVLFADSCSGTGTAVGEWKTKDRDNSSGGRTEKWLYAATKVDEHYCVNMSGADVASDSVTAGATGRDLARQLISEKRVTATKSV